MDDRGRNSMVEALGDAAYLVVPLVPLIIQSLVCAFQLRPRFGKIACQPRTKASQASMLGSQFAGAGKVRAWAAFLFSRAPGAHNLVGPNWKLRFCARFRSKFARCAVPEWLLVAPAGLRRTDLGPTGTVGAFFESPDFKCKCQATLSGSLAPCIAAQVELQWSWSPSSAASSREHAVLAHKPQIACEP